MFAEALACNVLNYWEKNQVARNMKTEIKNEVGLKKTKSEKIFG